MLNNDEWGQACDEIVERVLLRAEVSTPPVDAFAIASRLAVAIAWDADQAGRARMLRLSGAPSIFLKPDDRPERLQWAAAHELGEVHAHAVCERLGLAPDELLSRQREQVANQLANRLLIPTPWWRAAIQECGQDLRRLKPKFDTASHELLAWRLLDLPDAKIVTIIDHGQVTRRRANFTTRCPPVSGHEWHCCHSARTDGQAEREIHDLLPDPIAARAQAWAVHEPGWPREILVTWVDSVELLE